MPETQLRTIRESTSGPRPNVIAEVVRALSGLKYGAVEILVHDGQVTQIERREKLRIREDQHNSP